MSFVPAHIVAPPEDRPHTAFFVHGILGSGRNWRTFAGRLAERLPAWRFVLVDQRSHGESGNAPDPQTVDACAADLARLAGVVGQPDVVVGHSFGGKVALAYGELRPPGLRQVWSLDSPPFALPPPPPDAEVLGVMEILRDVPLPLARRNDVLAELGKRGLAPGLQRWMTTNLRKVDGGFVWTFDLDVARALIDDYFDRDCAGALEATQGPEALVVRAMNSDRWPAPWLDRLRGLPSEARGRYLELPDAGHCLHVDNPDGLLAMLLERLPR